MLRIWICHGRKFIVFAVPLRCKIISCTDMLICSKCLLDFDLLYCIVSCVSFKIIVPLIFEFLNAIIFNFIAMHIRQDVTQEDHYISLRVEGFEQKKKLLLWRRNSPQDRSDTTWHYNKGNNIANFWNKFEHHK